MVDVAQGTGAAVRSHSSPPASSWSAGYPYDAWMESLGLPIYRGFFITDLRTLELEWWDERKCQTAFIQLVGQEGVAEARVTEIAPGETLPPLKFALDEVVYVLDGRGLTTVSAGPTKPKKTFEWQTRSMFLIPHNHTHQLSNAQGDKPVRLLHYNYLPLATTTLQDIGFFFNNPYEQADIVGNNAEFYSEAKAGRDESAGPGGAGGNYWSGNFFPDMGAWDKVVPYRGRGAGGHVVFVRFPGAQLSAHMSIFPARTYKKAHRHGPGRVIVIPGGEGYSIMWQEGQEKIVVPWHEASVFVPPNRWFHQHFNAGATPARYLALHPAPQFSGHGETVEDRAKDQIEYTDEDPFVRQKFEQELATRGLNSIMPNEAYTVPGFEWEY